MATLKISKNYAVRAIAGMLLPAFLFSWSVAAWLENGQLNQLLWPSDINASIARLCGATVGVDAVGEPMVAVGNPAVLMRVMSVLALLMLVGWCRRRGHPANKQHAAFAESSLLTAVVMTFGASWWLVWLTGDFGFLSMQAFAVGCLPLWVSLTFALLAWVWLRLLKGASSAEAGAKENCGKGPWILVVSGMLAWIGVSFWMNCCLYEQLLIPHGDSAMYEEHLWNVWHGKGFRSYLDQGLFLGEHFQVIHLFLLPIHMIWPSHLLLELAESIALGSCCIPIFLITRRYSNSQWAACFLAIAWLFYFPMHYLDIAIDQKTFRPIALGIPFLFWLIEFSKRRQIKLACVCLLFALSAKEDLALIVFPLMCVLAVIAMRQAENETDASETTSATTAVSSRSAAFWFWAMAGFSFTYLVIVVTIGIPAFRSGHVVHYSQYFGDLGRSPGELIRNAIMEPGRVLSRLFSVRTMLYGLIFLGPLAFFPVRRPLILFSGVLTFTMLSLLQLSGDAGDLPPVPYHHFHSPLLPVLFWATAAALGSTQTARPHASRWSWLRQRIPTVSVNDRAALILLCCMFTSFTGSLMPCGASFWSEVSPFGRSNLFQPTDARQQERAAMADLVVQQIPLTARVASTDYIHTRLTHCERSYDYSDYLRAVNDFKPGVPRDTDYIVIDTGHRYSSTKSVDDVRELRESPEEWELLPDTTHGHFIILKRRAHKQE